MKTFIAVGVLSLFSSSGRAQFWSLPPSSTTDDVIVHDIGANAGENGWNSSTGLQQYSSLGDGNSDPLAPGAPDAHTGLVWQGTLPEEVQTVMTNIDKNGGTVRTILVGETAGWLNDFGYTYSGDPTTHSFTAYQAIQSVGDNPTVKFGQYFDVALLQGQASQFDLWLNGVGAMGPNPPAGPSAFGGIYTAFHPSNSSVNSGSQFLWAQTPLHVNTFMPATNGYSPVNTYLLSAEDWRLDAGADADYSDVRVGLQFFDASGSPLGSPIPEPATAALIAGALGVCGAGVLRRYRASSQTIPEHRG